jgi:hypothetical protein
MPTPSGLKISQLPSGLRPSGSDLLAIVQNGNTVQVPVSSIRINTTAELPESGNLYYTDARARAAFSAGDGLFYNSEDGIFALNGEFDTKLNTGYLSSIIGVNVSDEGRKKTIFIQTIGMMMMGDPEIRKVLDYLSEMSGNIGARSGMRGGIVNHVLNSGITITFGSASLW